MTPRAAIAALVLLLAAGCAASRQPWREVQVPEVYVELLPRGAQLEVDGRALGPGARAVPVPDPAHLYRLRASAPGFQSAEAAGEGQRWAGIRVTLVLRPEGYGSARRLDEGDPADLAQAASVLLHAGRPEDARDYAARSLELAEVPLSHKVLGAVYAQRGDRRKAAQHYSIYLSLVPNAPDAKEIAAVVARARGDVTLPGVGEQAAPAR